MNPKIKVNVQLSLETWQFICQQLDYAVSTQGNDASAVACKIREVLHVGGCKID